jgi:hypothetical protein
MVRVYSRSLGLHSRISLFLLLRLRLLPLLIRVGIRINISGSSRRKIRVSIMLRLSVLKWETLTKLGRSIFVRLTKLLCILSWPYIFRSILSSGNIGSCKHTAWRPSILLSWLAGSLSSSTVDSRQITRAGSILIKHLGSLTRTTTIITSILII